MKFCKRYEEYMQGSEAGLPGVGLKKLKKALKRCTRGESNFQHQVLHQDNQENSGTDLQESNRICSDHCSACDGIFFPTLEKELSEAVVCFTERARGLLGFDSSFVFKKYIPWFRRKNLPRNHAAFMQEVNYVIKYAIINSVAMRKILKKYDKIHHSKQGQVFRSKAQSMNMDFLRSPWLCELLAFYINLSRKAQNQAITAPHGECSLAVDDGKPTLSLGVLDSLKLDIDLTCSICLDTVFDAVSLACGHIFCYMCCCSSASVTTVDGLKSVGPAAKCPLCRQAGVYKRAVHLDELNLLLSRSCPGYWERRLRTERKERVRQAKEHWDSQCRSFLGA